MTPSSPPSFSFHRATPAGEGGVAIFELYGEGAGSVLSRLFRGAELPAEGRSRLGALVDLEGDDLDEVVVSRVPAVGTWSRMSAWTVSVHGGVWVQSRVGEVLTGVGGAERSRREVLLDAVNRGALDAIEAAAFEHLIGARTERAAAFFSRQYHGELSGRIHEFIRDFIRPPNQPASRQRCGNECVDGTRRLDDLLRRAPAAYRLANPLRLLIAGRPNSGKSTLFNALVERERVVVSDKLGTTRDLIREVIALKGFPVELIDSVGLHSAPSDPVEKEAVEKIWRQEVDAVLYLVAAPWNVHPEERGFFERFPAARVLKVATFRDLGLTPEALAFPVQISATSGEGLTELRRAIVAGWLDPDGEADEPPDLPAPFTLRQHRLLEAAHDSWQKASSMPPGAESRLALDAVGEALIICLRSSWPDEAA